MNGVGPVGCYQNWHQWRQVIHGGDALGRLEGELSRLGRGRPFVVTTPSLVATDDVLGLVRAGLGRDPVGCFGASRRGAPRSTVLAAAAQARSAGCDVLVSVGGGSVVDTAKGVALAVAFGIDDDAGFDPLRAGAATIGLTSPTLPVAPLPIVAVPTTLSGAEYTGMIGITDERTAHRDPYRFDELAPETVVLDPRATTATPAPLWRSTGVKALSDAFEQYVSGTAGPAFEPQLVEAVRLLASSLVESADGDLAARLRCQIAGWLTMFATFNVSSRVGIGAALRHQLGMRFGIPHGEATCPVLVEVIRRTCPDGPRGAALLDATAALARFDRVGTGAPAAGALADRARGLLAALGLPADLSAVGLSSADVGDLADRVVADFANRHRAVRAWGADEVRELLRAAT